MSQTVIFDVGRVLIDWDIKHIYRDLLPDDAAIDAFLAEVGWHAWNIKLDRGNTWDKAVAELSAQFPHHHQLIEASHHRWQDAVPGPIDGTVHILDTLHQAEVPLYAITNFSFEKWAEIKQRFPFLATHFKDVVVSGTERLIKPDRAIYDLCLTRNNLVATDCIFIDDSLANIKTANALGIDAIHFTSPDALQTDLRKRGLLA